MSLDQIRDRPPETPEDVLAAMGLVLPAAAPTPIGNFVTAIRTGNLLFVSGQGPVTPDGRLMTGKVGADVSAEDAAGHARLVGLNLLAAVRHELGSLSAIRRVVKLLGMVNATPDFADHPTVINGCSDLLVQVLGSAGMHARSAVGMNSLPNGITVEIEAIFESHDH